MNKVIDSGGNLGLVCGNFLSGALTSAYGWEIVFYVLGLLLVIWFCFWSFLCYNEPSSHPRISKVRIGTDFWNSTRYHPRTQEEKDYIEANSEASASSSERLPPMPLVKVAMSLPVWALQYSLIGYYWVIYTIVTLSPLYYDTVYDLPVDLVIDSVFLSHADLFNTCCLTDWLHLRNPLCSIHHDHHPGQLHSAETREQGHHLSPVPEEVLHRIWLHRIKYRFGLDMNGMISYFICFHRSSINLAGLRQLRPRTVHGGYFLRSWTMCLQCSWKPGKNHLVQIHRFSFYD